MIDQIVLAIALSQTPDCGDRRDGCRDEVREKWDPDRASDEMAELFNKADRIFDQSHYQENEQ